MRRRFSRKTRRRNSVGTRKTRGMCKRKAKGMCERKAKGMCERKARGMCKRKAKGMRDRRKDEGLYFSWSRRTFAPHRCAPRIAAGDIARPERQWEADEERAMNDKRAV